MIKGIPSSRTAKPGPVWRGVTDSDIRGARLSFVGREYTESEDPGSRSILKDVTATVYINQAFVDFVESIRWMDKKRFESVVSETIEEIAKCEIESCALDVISRQQQKYYLKQEQ